MPKQEPEYISVMDFSKDGPTGGLLSPVPKGLWECMSGSCGVPTASFQITPVRKPRKRPIQSWERFDANRRVSS